MSPHGDGGRRPGSTRVGFTFLGWSDRPSGGDLWDFTTDTVSDLTVLSAQWEADGELARTGTLDVAAALALAALLVLSGAGLAIVAPRRRDALGR